MLSFKKHNGNGETTVDGYVFKVSLFLFVVIPDFYPSPPSEQELLSF